MPFNGIVINYVRKSSVCEPLGIMNIGRDTLFDIFYLYLGVASAHKGDNNSERDGEWVPAWQ